MGVGHRLAVQKNDQIEVIAGKDKGKRGKVLRVLPKLDKILVEKINFVKRHTKPGRLGQRGGILERENPLHVSNVQLVCPAIYSMSFFDTAGGVIVSHVVINACNVGLLI